MKEIKAILFIFLLISSLHSSTVLTVLKNLSDQGLYTMYDDGTVIKLRSGQVIQTADVNGVFTDKCPGNVLPQNINYYEFDSYMGQLIVAGSDKLVKFSSNCNFVEIKTGSYRIRADQNSPDLYFQPTNDFRSFGKYNLIGDSIYYEKTAFAEDVLHFAQFNIALIQTRAFIYIYASGDTTFVTPIWSTPYTSQFNNCIIDFNYSKRIVICLEEGKVLIVDYNNPSAIVIEKTITLSGPCRRIEKYDTSKLLVVMELNGDSTAFIYDGANSFSLITNFNICGTVTAVWMSYFGTLKIFMATKTEILTICSSTDPTCQVIAQQCLPSCLVPNCLTCLGSADNICQTCKPGFYLDTFKRPPPLNFNLKIQSGYNFIAQKNNPLLKNFVSINP